MSIHHPNLVHGSNANTSKKRRCGLTIRYMRSSVDCSGLPKQPLLMLQGKNFNGNNVFKSWPKYRPGYDYKFKGAKRWNKKRIKVKEDEEYFARTDFKQMDAEILWEINDFIRELL